MNMTALRTWWLSLAAVLLIAIAGLGASMVQAQDEAGDAVHPAHIHAGSCDELGDVAYPLSSVGSEMLVNGTPMAGSPASEASGEAAESSVAASVTDVEAALQDLLSGDYAINVHKSAGEIGTYIACGDLDGAAMLGDAAVIGLHELNDSAHVGIAVLRPSDDGTEVSLYLGEGLARGAGNTTGQNASPAAAEATTSEVTVEIIDFAYAPDPVEITAGATVTWVNRDPEPHTATGDGGSFQSGTLRTDESFSYTFDQPGTYEYFCEFHPNMNGTVNVT